MVRIEIVSNETRGDGNGDDDGIRIAATVVIMVYDALVYRCNIPPTSNVVFSICTPLLRTTVIVHNIGPHKSCKNQHTNMCPLLCVVPIQRIQSIKVLIFVHENHEN